MKIEKKTTQKQETEKKIEIEQFVFVLASDGHIDYSAYCILYNVLHVHYVNQRLSLNCIQTE